MRLTTQEHALDLSVAVSIHRPNGRTEKLFLLPMPGHQAFQSQEAPAEPHEFEADLEIIEGDGPVTQLPFRMTEPEGHHH